MIKLTDIIFEGKLSKSEIKKMRDKFDKTGKLPPHLQKLADLMKKNTKVKQGYSFFKIYTDIPCI